MLKHLPQPGGTAWIVEPDGKPRSVKFSSTVASPLLEVTYERDENDRPCAVLGVDVSRAAERAGYRMLKDLYEAEGIEGGFETFLDHQAQCRRRGLAQTIPDDYLPDACIAMRGQSKSKEVVLPPSPKLAKQNAAAAQPKSSRRQADAV